MSKPVLCKKWLHNNCVTIDKKWTFLLFSANLTFKWPWCDLDMTSVLCLLIENSLFEYLTHFWDTETNHRYCNIKFSLLFGFASEYFDLSRSMTSRGHQRSNPIYLHILKWPLGYVLQVVEIPCFNHKMHNRLPYLLNYYTCSYLTLQLTFLTLKTITHQIFFFFFSNFDFGIYFLILKKSLNHQNNTINRFSR